jgi:hypothetical protein
MRYNFLVVLFILTAKWQAQTLTAANFNPLVGERFDFLVSTSTIVVPGVAGSGKMWNFGGASGYDGSSDSVLSNNNLADFPNCTFRIKHFSSFDEGSTYYNASGNNIQVEGFSGTPSPTKHSDPEITMIYPLKLGAMTTDVIVFPGLSGTATLTADATGTLITPYQTYTNTIRLHSVQSFTNTFQIQQAEMFTWYTPGIHTKLVSIIGYTTNGNPSGTHAIIYKDPKDAVGISSENLAFEGIKIYPNPASEILQFANFDRSFPAEILIYNRNSEQVMRGILDGHNKTLDITGLGPGMYVVCIKRKGTIRNEKLIVLRP